MKKSTPFTYCRTLYCGTWWLSEPFTGSREYLSKKKVFFYLRNVDYKLVFRDWPTTVCVPENYSRMKQKNVHFAMSVNERKERMKENNLSNKQ